MLIKYGSLSTRHLAYQPVLKHGIPSMDSVEYDAFWKLQVHRMKNGYRPSHAYSWIPGRYYFYLNFPKIRSLYHGGSRKVLDYPYHVDVHLEIANFLEEAKRDKTGGIILKARRAGITLDSIGQILLPESLIYEDNTIGVGCYTEQQIGSYRIKHDNMFNTLHPFFKTVRSKDNSKEIQYKKTGSTIFFRDFWNKTGSFRGEELTWQIFEESGENRVLKDAYLVSEECWKEGDVQYGVPIIFGTSNQINNGFLDLEELWYNADQYNLKKLFIPASKAYYPYINLKTGVSGIKKAEQVIESNAAIKKLLKDKKAYYTYRQEKPLKEEHAFMLGASSLFNLEYINTQIAYLNQNKGAQNMLVPGRIEWAKTTDKEILRTETEWITDPDGPILMLYKPLDDNSHNFDVGGVDPYTKDKSLVSGSLGSLHIYRGDWNINEPGELPILEYVERPAKKEIFYETCAKIAVHYKVKLLVEDTDEEFFKWFVTNGFANHLKEAPLIYKTRWTKASNIYGYNMSGSNRKGKIITNVGEYIDNSCSSIYFKHLLKEMTVFGLKNTDRVISFGLALTHSKDNAFIKVHKMTATVNKSGIMMPVFKMKNGIIQTIFASKNE